MEEFEGVAYMVRGIIGQGFASIVWELVCIAEVNECGACEKEVDRDGFFKRIEL